MELKKFDKKFFKKKVSFIAGVDEAGRGPLAGPVVAAAVIFSKRMFISGINDSKKLTKNKREQLYELILQKAVSVGVGIVECAEIEELNILHASLKAMKIAISNLSRNPDLVLIDGNKIFDSKIHAQCIVKGDAKSFSIAAASIIAKVTRDRIMEKYAEKYPFYLWEKNSGYGTKFHREAIVKYGYTPIHRPTFLRNLKSVYELKPFVE